MANKSYFLEIENYLENLVNQTDHIKTFVPLSDRDIDNKMSGNTVGPFFVLISYKGALNENKQRTIGRRNLTFAILLKAPHDNALVQRQKIDEAEWIGLNVLSKIDLDSQLGTPDWMKHAFIKETVHYEETQYEQFSGLFGQEFSLDLNIKNPLKYESNFWK